MGGIFGGGSKADPPPLPPPTAIPEVGPEVSDYAMRTARKKKGWTAQLITGSLEPKKKGKTVLG